MVIAADLALSRSEGVGALMLGTVAITGAAVVAEEAGVFAEGAVLDAGVEVDGD